MSFPGPVIVIPPGTKVVVCSFSYNGIHFIENNPGTTFVPFERSNRLILQDSMIVLFRDQNDRTYGHGVQQHLEDGIIRVWMKDGKERVFIQDSRFALEIHPHDFKNSKITNGTFQSFLVQAETKEDLERIERFFEMLPLIEDYNAVESLIGIPENPSDILRFIKPNAEIFNEIIYKNGKMRIMFYFWYKEQQSYDLFFAVRNLSIDFPFDFDYRICQMTDDEQYIEDEKFHQRFTIPFSDTKVRKKDRSLLFFEGCWDFTSEFFLEITPKDDNVNVSEIARLHPKCEMISGAEDMKLFFMEIARKIEQTKS